MSVKYARSVFTSVAVFSLLLPFGFLERKFDIKCNLGSDDWFSVNCQNHSNKNLNVGDLGYV